MMTYGEFGRDIRVNAHVSWSGDIFRDADLDQVLATFSGDSYAGMFDFINKAAKSVVRAVPTVARTARQVAVPVAALAPIASGVSAVVFPPAAPVIAAVGGQAAVAATIAAKLESGDAAARAKASQLIHATRELATSSHPDAEGARNALAAIEAALTARKNAANKPVAFVVTKRGIVLRVK